MRRLLRYAPVVLGVGACSPAIVAGPEGPRPIARSSIWAPLPLPAAQAPAKGEVALEPGLDGRVSLPGGSFVMGSSPLELKHAVEECQREPLGILCDEDDSKRIFLAEAPAHDVTVSPFALDRTEVSVRAYRRCVEAGACPPPARGTHDPRFDRPELPVTFVDWDAATEYCRWAGGRLPTEAEWELAARGPEGRLYPWGNVYNPYLANHGSLSIDQTDATDGFVGLAPVGSFVDGATPQGILDLAGNVAEWVFDRFDPDPQGFGYPGASRLNPTGPKSGALHIVRGGSFVRGAAWLRGAARRPELGPSEAVGFRCAADVR